MRTNAHFPKNFVGHISIEYEYNWANHLTDVTRSIDFIRDLGTKK